MWLILGQLSINAGWWDAPSTLRDLAEAICTIPTVSTLLTPSLVTIRTSHCLLHPDVFNSSNDFKFLGILAFSYEFHVLTVFLHLWRHPLILYHSVELRRIFLPLSLDKEILNSLRFFILLINTRKKKKSWSHPRSPISLSKTRKKMMQLQLVLG